MTAAKRKPRAVRAWAVVCKSGALFSDDHESYILDAADVHAHDGCRDMVRTCDAQYDCGPHRVVRCTVTLDARRPR